MYEIRYISLNVEIVSKIIEGKDTEKVYYMYDQGRIKLNDYKRKLLMLVEGN